MTIPWIQATEDVTGENHPDGNTDVANRAPRFIITSSGLGDDGSWSGGDFPGFIPNFVNAGSPEGVVTAKVGQFCHDSTVSGKLYYKLTGTGNTGWIQIETGVARETRTFGFSIGGGGSLLSLGVVGHLRYPFNWKDATITRWTLLADQVGSVVVDIWKDTFANYPPTVADSITASSKPTITSSNKAEDATLASWNLDVLPGDVFAFNIDSVTSITQALLIVEMLED